MPVVEIFLLPGVSKHFLTGRCAGSSRYLLDRFTVVSETAATAR